MSFRPTLSVSTLIACVTAFAAAFAVAGSGMNDVIFSSSVVSLFIPGFAWFILRCLNMLPERRHGQVYLTFTCFAFGLYASLMLPGSTPLGVPSLFFMLMVWVPQLMWIAFFEFCEWEQRDVGN